MFVTSGITQSSEMVKMVQDGHKNTFKSADEMVLSVVKPNDEFDLKSGTYKLVVGTLCRLSFAEIFENGLEANMKTQR